MGPYHFALFQLSDVLIEYKFPLSFDLGLLPDGMLREEFVGSSESCIMEHARIAFEHIPNSRTQL